MLLLAAAILFNAQSPVVQRLERAEATLAHDFSLVRGVRELSDGRVLVSDQTEKKLLLADFRSGAIRILGREGAGPQEYRLPGRLVAMPGDTTLMLDPGNSRIAVIAPSGSIVRNLPSQRPGTVYSIDPTGSDAQGRLYFEVPGWTQQPRLPGDSVVVVRWTPRTDRIDTLARIRSISYLTSRKTPGIGYVIFSPQDVWQVAPNGDLALVRSSDYHVEWRRSDGALTRGPAVPFQPQPVSAADKHEYVRRFMDGALVSGRGQHLTALQQDAASAAEIAAMVPNQSFAPTRPPFLDRMPRIDSNGALWVERSGPLTGASVFDLFDSSGKRIAAASLPLGRRLMTFGAGVLYAVHTDADGLQHLERYRLPAK